MLKASKKKNRGKKSYFKKDLGKGLKTNKKVWLQTATPQASHCSIKNCSTISHLGASCPEPISRDKLAVGPSCGLWIVFDSEGRGSWLEFLGKWRVETTKKKKSIWLCTKDTTDSLIHGVITDKFPFKAQSLWYL